MCPGTIVRFLYEQQIWFAVIIPPFDISPLESVSV